MNEWTEAAVELLKKCWDERMSASQAAVHLNTSLGTTFTRNAIIGKVMRLKLIRTRPALTARSEKIIEDKRRAKRGDGTGNAKALATKVVRSKKVWAKTVSEAIEPETALEDSETMRILRSDAWKPIGDAPLLPLIKLNDHTCKWPIGDPLEPGFGFCGYSPIEGKPYCGQHSRLSYVAPRVNSR